MNDKKSRTLSLERTFDAPRNLVWEAWTQPEHIAAWWGPGMETEVVEHDFKVGGCWQYIMKTSDRQVYTADGIFSLIIRHEKICSSANFKPMTEGVEIEAIFIEAGASTKFIFNVIHPNEAYCKIQAEMGVMNGWGANFNELHNYLAVAFNNNSSL